MPIEIRQLIIRSTVGEAPGSAQAAENLPLAGAPLFEQMRSDLRAELIAECRALIEERLQRDQGR